MARKSTQRKRMVRYASLDDMPPPKRLNRRLIEMSDEDVERRGAADPDAGVIPQGFWDNAKMLMPETKQQITLRLDADIIERFRATGPGWQARINEALRKAG